MNEGRYPSMVLGNYSSDVANIKNTYVDVYIHVYFQTDQNIGFLMFSHEFVYIMFWGFPRHLYMVQIHVVSVLCCLSSLQNKCDKCVFLVIYVRHWHNKIMFYQLVNVLFLNIYVFTVHTKN